MPPLDPDIHEVLRELIDRHLLVAPGFVGLVLIGSRAHGESRLDSDVDVIVIFDEVDERVVPGEFVWDAAADTFHSIFEEVAGPRSIQVDAVGRRVAWGEFSVQEWPEALMHDLARGVVLEERSHDVSGLIRSRTAYPDAVRVNRLAHSIGRAEYLLEAWRLERWPERGGWLGANDQIDAAFEELIAGLHAFNRVWMPWRYRHLVSALKLQWLPGGFAESVDLLKARAARDLDGLLARAQLVAEPLEELVDAVEKEGLEPAIRQIGAEPFAGLGFASNMQEWRRAHDQWRREQALPDRSLDR